MSARVTLLLAAFFLVAVTLGAATAPTPTAAQPLILRIREIPEQGHGDERDCPDANPACSADIKSTLAINPDLSRLPAGAAPVSIVDPLDSARRDQINIALKALNRSLERSKQIAAGVARALSEADLKELSDEFEADRRAMLDAIVNYEQLDPANAAKSRREILRIPEVRNAFGDPNATPPIPRDIGGFLASKIEELDARAAARVRAAAAASGYVMKMGVFRIRKGTDPMPVHLPGYDTYNTLSPAQLPRITTNISAAEAAENTREIKATMDLVALTKTNFADLAREYTKKLDALKQRLQQQTPALTGGVSHASSLVDDLTQLSTKLTQLGTTNNNAALKKAGTDLANLRESVQALTKTLKDLQSTLTTATAGIPKATEGAVAPDTVLRNLLGVATTGIAGVSSGAKSASAQLKDVQTTLSTIAGDVTNIASAERTEAETLTARVKSELVDALAAPLGELLGPDLSASIQDILKTVNTAAPLLDLEAPQILTVADIVPTRLEIPRADPAEGDVLDFAVQLFKDEKADKPVYEEHRSVTVRFYGWHSGLASGLIFVRADKPKQADFKPEAAAIWRIQMTPRADDTNFFYKLRPAGGIHVTTLHFSTPSDSTTTTESTNNDNVQFGAGVSLHLFGDIVQAGYGWNLGVTKDRGYMYLGLGIMNLLRSRLGQSTTP